MRTTLVFLVLFSAGFVVSRSFANTAPAPAAPPLAALSSDPVVDPRPDCSGGPTAHLDVSLVPDAIDRRGGSDVLSARAQVRNHGQHAAQVSYTYEVVSDVGESLLRAPGISQRLARGGELPPGLVRTPQNLPDGYYQVRLTAKAQGEDGDVELMDHLYFRMRAGALEMIDADAWYAQSQVNVGVAE